MQLEYLRTSDCSLSGALTMCIFASHLPSPVLEELVEVSNCFFEKELRRHQVMSSREGEASVCWYCKAVQRRLVIRGDKA